MVRYYISIYKENIYEKNLTQLKPVVPSPRRSTNNIYRIAWKLLLLVCLDW